MISRQDTSISNRQWSLGPHSSTGVQSAHLDALVEAARGENEVKLVVASRLRVLAGQVVRDDVAGVGGFTGREHLRLPAIRQLRPHELQPMASILSNTVWWRASQYGSPKPCPYAMLRSPAARMRCVSGFLWPMKAEMSEMMRWTEPSAIPYSKPGPFLTPGCDPIHRAYMETTMNGSVEPSAA